MAKDRSLTETPTWAVATIISLMVIVVFSFTKSVEFCGRWLDKTKRKTLVAALNKIKEELVVFGVLSLLMGHFTIFVAKICIKSSVFSTRYYPCIPETTSAKSLEVVQHIIVSNYSKYAPLEHQDYAVFHARKYCDEGYESFASYESLEQLHRLLFVLGVIHVTYSSMAIALAVIKIYSWRAWEDEAKALASQASQDNTKIKRLCSFVVNRAYHPWSQHKVYVWLLCFSRQFWSSINKSDYGALRFGFVTTHQLPLSYDFFNYMVRSMDEEFRDIVGISLPLWVYAIVCIFLDFHGTDVYFWLSFLPAFIIIIIGTKLHHIVVKLAVEIVDSQSYLNTQEFKLRDELFWFRNPRLLLRFIQFITFQNAFEMAMFLWSLWEIKGTSCFMDNPTFLVTRLTFGIISQVWCSFITFPLYVLITQMGSRFKSAVISEGVRRSLHGWKSRVKARQNSYKSNNNVRLSSASSLPLIHNMDRYDDSGSNRSNTNVSTSSGRRIWRNEGSRRFSLVDFGDKVWADFDNDSVSDHSYTDEDDNHREDVRYARLP